MSFYLCASSFLSKGSILSGEEGYSCPKRRMCLKRGTFPKRRVYPKRRMFPMRHLCPMRLRDKSCAYCSRLLRRYVVFVGAYCSWSFPSSHRVDWPMRLREKKRRILLAQPSLYAEKAKGKELSLVCGALLRLGYTLRLRKEIRIQGRLR